MVSLLSLWLPILLAAVGVFVVSSVIHMFLTYHQNDYDQVPNEDQVRGTIRPLNIPPGQYMVPKPANAKAMGSPEFQAKVNEGPVVLMMVYPNQQFAMGKQLVQWFVYCLVVGLFAAYLASRTLDPGEVYLEVFRVTGTVAFVGYGLALVQQTIWFRFKWSATLKSLADALVYGLVTGGFFGWLWP